MTKQKAKAQEPVAQEPAAIDGNQGEVVGNGAGEALPEVALQPVEQEAAPVVPAPEPKPLPEPESEDVIDVFVLCDGSLNGDARYKAGCVLQGVPEPLAKANSHWLDSHPAAVEAAMGNGAQVLTYEA